MTRPNAKRRQRSVDFSSPGDNAELIHSGDRHGTVLFWERLADDGYDLLLPYHSKPEAVQALEQRLASRVAVSGIALDLTDEASVAAARRHVEAAGTSLSARLRGNFHAAPDAGGQGLRLRFPRRLGADARAGHPLISQAMDPGARGRMC